MKVRLVIMALVVLDGFVARSYAFEVSGWFGTSEPVIQLIATAAIGAGLVGVATIVVWRGRNRLAGSIRGLRRSRWVGGALVAPPTYGGPGVSRVRDQNRGQGPVVRPAPRDLPQDGSSKPDAVRAEFPEHSSVPADSWSARPPVLRVAHVEIRSDGSWTVASSGHALQDSKQPSQRPTKGAVVVTNSTAIQVGNHNRRYVLHTMRVETTKIDLEARLNDPNVRGAADALRKDPANPALRRNLIDRLTAMPFIGDPRVELRVTSISAKGDQGLIGDILDGMLLIQQSNVVQAGDHNLMECEVINTVEPTADAKQLLYGNKELAESLVDVAFPPRSVADPAKLCQALTKALHDLPIQPGQIQFEVDYRDPAPGEVLVVDGVQSGSVGKGNVSRSTFAVDVSGATVGPISARTSHAVTGEALGLSRAGTNTSIPGGRGLPAGADPSLWPDTRSVSESDGFVRPADVDDGSVDGFVRPADVDDKSEPGTAPGCSPSSGL